MNQADLENLIINLVSLFGVGTSMLIPLLFFLGIIFFIIAFSVVLFVISGFPIYRMAKNAGFRHPIFAFIPFLQTYLLFFLPQEEFNLFNVVKIKDRHKAALYMTLVTNAPILISIVLIVIAFIPFLGPILASLISSVSSLFSIAICIVGWKCYYDIYRLYDVGENAILLSILSLFIPMLTIVMTFVLMNKEPFYGFGNIYNAPIENEDYTS